MKINDKVLTAFLVSMGLFSVLQAKVYVNSLSPQDKQTLLVAAVASGDEVAPTDGVREPTPVEK